MKSLWLHAPYGLFYYLIVMVVANCKYRDSQSTPTYSVHELLSNRSTSIAVYAYTVYNFVT